MLLQINNSLELDLITEELTLTNLIAKIKLLIIKPPIIEEQKVQNLEKKLTLASQTITHLKEQIKKISSPTPRGEKIEVIIKTDLQNLNQLFPHRVDQFTCQQLEKAQTYQELVQVRGDFIQKQLQKNLTNWQVIREENSSLIKKQKRERALAISFFTLSLLAVGVMLIKLKS